MTESERITNGPDKWDLISSFADRKPITFEIGALKISGLISDIEHEDGSGQSFNIGLQTGCNGAIKQVYYHAKTRKGHISARLKN